MEMTSWLRWHPKERARLSRVKRKASMAATSAGLVPRSAKACGRRVV
jgi:hypothetical protein